LSVVRFSSALRETGGTLNVPIGSSQRACPLAQHEEGQKPFESLLLSVGPSTSRLFLTSSSALVSPIRPKQLVPRRKEILLAQGDEACQADADIFHPHEGRRRRPATQEDRMFGWRFGNVPARRRRSRSAPGRPRTYVQRCPKGTTVLFCGSVFGCVLLCRRLSWHEEYMAPCSVLVTRATTRESARAEVLLHPPAQQMLS
jgi:hypothetical protein